MTRQDTVKFLCLVSLQYPKAFKSLEKDEKEVMIQMWQRAFSNIPYALMEEVFDRYVISHRYAPQIVDVKEELERIHTEAFNQAELCRMFGRTEEEKVYRNLANTIKPDNESQKLKGIDQVKRQAQMRG